MGPDRMAGVDSDHVPGQRGALAELAQRRAADCPAGQTGAAAGVTSGPVLAATQRSKIPLYRSDRH
jgi:hypothetical protein